MSGSNRPTLNNRRVAEIIAELKAEKKFVEQAIRCRERQEAPSAQEVNQLINLQPIAPESRGRKKPVPEAERLRTSDRMKKYWKDRREKR